MSLRLEKLLIHLLYCAIIKVNLVRPETLETWERDRRYGDKNDKLEFWERDPKYEAGRHETKFGNHVRSARKRMWQYRRHAIPIATDTIYSKQEKLRQPVEISGTSEPIDNYTFNIQLMPRENNFKTYIDKGQAHKRKKRKEKKKRTTEPMLKQERTNIIVKKRTDFTIDRFYHRVQDEQNTTTDTSINKKLKGRRKNKKHSPAGQKHHHHRHKQQNRFRAPLLDSYLDNDTIKELEKIARSSDIEAVDFSQETTTQKDNDSFLKIILVPESPEKESNEQKIIADSEERPFKDNNILQSDSISNRYKITENTETTMDDSVTLSEMSATDQSGTSTVFMATQGIPVDEDEKQIDMSAINMGEASITYTTRDSSEGDTVPASNTTAKDVLRGSFTDTTTDSSDENVVLQSDTTAAGKSVMRTTHKIKNNGIDGDGTNDIVTSSNLSSEANNESPATEKEHSNKKTRTHSKTKKMEQAASEFTTLPPIGRKRHKKRMGKKKQGKKHKTQDTTVIRNRKETSAEEFSGIIRPHNLKKHMQYLMKQFPEVKTKIEVIGTTVGYNDIVMLKLSPIKSKCGHFRADDKYVKEGPSKQYVFIVHGLNTMGIEDMHTFTETKQFKELLSYYIKQLDKFDILLVPMANPDGYAYSLQSQKMWNKNMSPQDDCPGVALDRNFEVAWKERRNVSSCSQLYPGPTPLSEKETLAISSIFHKYSNKIYAYIHVHPGTYSARTFKGEAVLFPKGYTEVQSDDDKYVDLKGEIDEAMRNASFNVMSVTVDNLAIWYGVVTGSSVDFASTIYGIPYAMEFVMQSYMESEGVDALKEIWQRIITATFTAMYNKYTNKEI